MLSPGCDVVFLPGDPPRTGRFAALGDGPDQVEVVTLQGGRARRLVVPARLTEVQATLPALLSLDPEGGSASARAWSVATVAGLGLLSRGRLAPASSPAGFDAWRVGPLDSADAAWLRELADGFPAVAHCLPVAGSRPIRVRSAERLVREYWDALADTLVRTPAAELVSGAALFASPEPQPVNGQLGWLTESAAGVDAGAQLGLRVELDTHIAGEGRAVLQLRSNADPSLVVDVADLWAAPAAVLARFGERAEADLLLALRRGARAWAPLGVLLGVAAPAALPLGEDELADLFGEGAARLSASGVELLWPTELFADGLTVQAVVQTPPPVVGAGFSLDSLLEFRWQLTLGGDALTDEELDALAEAKRPIIRLRGRWVRADPQIVEQLRRRRERPMRLAEALAAVLAGEIELDGETIAVRADAALAGLIDRLSAAASNPRELNEPPGLHAELRHYQRRGLGWLAEMTEAGFGGCLADDMGLGKTVQVIALHCHRRGTAAGPTLVVCPASLLGNWQRELARFAPEVPCRRFHGGGRHLIDVGAEEVVLTTYGIVRADRAALAEVGWGLVVADEAQHAKNPLSRTARELRALPSRARVALTGTPVENRLSELWSILDWTTPGLLGPLERFQQTVAVPVERYRDPQVTARLTRVLRPFLLRRRKTDPGIAPELPQKTVTDHAVPLTPEQTTLYAAVVRETLAQIEQSEGIARRALVLKLLTALKQICNHPAQYLHQAGPLRGRSGKLAALDELLDIVLAERESTLVFSQYKQMGALMEAHLAGRGVPTLFLHGGVAIPRREQMVVDFQSGKAPVFLLSLKAGGVGLNLTRATHVIHYDRWWNPAVEDQATDRAHRIGQDRPVQVHRLVAEGTVEDRIAALLESKRELAETVVGAGEGWLTELSTADLAALVNLGSPG
ncbi:MAG TPA: DEAD/DEAH box helicase [Mycobacteriales bacterium]|nr:DEAD/DEAH box helicase [Mycobacteriales bacterium]